MAIVHIKRSCCHGDTSVRLAIYGRSGMQTNLFEVPKTYSALILDPPWHYELRKNDPTHRGKITYPSMSFEEIRDLPIPDLADSSGCTMFLWFTNNYLIEAGELTKFWGFKIKTILTWEKVTKAGNTRIGNSHWFRSATEHCIIATKGKVVAFNSYSKLARCTPNLIKAERREHSRKPDEFYRLVEEVCQGSKLELFARQRRHGWDCWGNEVDKFEMEGAIA
jgi:N6-adenosine-specific RNA methylase IME4